MSTNPTSRFQFSLGAIFGVVTLAGVASYLASILFVGNANVLESDLRIEVKSVSGGREFQVGQNLFVSEKAALARVESLLSLREANYRVIRIRGYGEILEWQTSRSFIEGVYGIALRHNLPIDDAWVRGDQNTIRFASSAGDPYAMPLDRIPMLISDWPTATMPSADCDDATTSTLRDSLQSRSITTSARVVAP